MFYSIKTLTTGLFVSFALSFIGSHAAVAEQPAYDGLIEPNVVVNLGSPVRGLVDSVETRRSTLVQKGEILIQLESSVQQVMVDRAQTLVQTTAELQLQEEKFSFALRSLERMNGLYDSAAISPQAKDKAETEASMAGYIMEKAKEQRLLDKLELKHAQAMLALRTIKSPMSGVVMEIFVSPGEFIDEQPLLKLAEIDPLLVEVILPATLFGSVKPGHKAIIKPEIQSEGEHIATVTIVDKVLDVSSSTFGVRLLLPNPDLKIPGGQRCSVSFLSAEGTVIPEIDLELNTAQSE